MIQCFVFFLSSWTALLTNALSSNAPFLKAQDMVGIWKVSKKVNHPYPNPSEFYKEALAYGSGYEDELVLRLNDDGTFDPYVPPVDQYDENSLELNHLLGRGGNWEFQNDNLLLAANRPERFHPFHSKDTLFCGKPQAVVTETMEDAEEAQLEAERNGESNTATVTKKQDVDVHLAIPQGQIKSGKFLYPRKHNMFFDDPVLFKPANLGFFFMNQLLGNLNAVPPAKPETDTTPAPLFQASDLYNRTFYLATEEHGVSEQHIAQDKHCHPDLNPLWDVRVLQVTFFQNNTFVATGTEKTLRGKFGITGADGDRLWLQVSIFGAGRSVTGSVYSEGRFVSQQDKRGYTGPIQAYPNAHNETIYYVHGDYYEGMPDLDRPQLQQTAGTFTLQEVQEVDLENYAEECGLEDYYEDDSYYTTDPYPWEGEEDAFL